MLRITIFAMMLPFALGACQGAETARDDEQRKALLSYEKKNAPAESPEVAQKGAVRAEVRDLSDCPSGCSLKKHDVAPFTVEQYQKALTMYASAPLKAESTSLDTLLFYGERTRELMTRYGASSLPRTHLDFLQRELSRTHALVAIRIVDANGIVRANLPWQRVPFGHKQHLHPQASDIQEMSFNGSVMRTGLGHIWARY